MSSTVYLWQWMSPEQRAAAVKGREGIGLAGEPPSGPDGVLWLQDEGGWRWKTGLWPDDLRRGIRIGTPAGAPVAIPALLQTVYVVTPAAPPPVESPGPAPQVKAKKGRR